MNDSSDTGNGTSLDVAEAAAIMQQAGERARREFRGDHRGSFTVWGLALLLGYGAMWLGVRDQRPYHGLDPAAFAAMTLIAAFAGSATTLETRSGSGVGGLSAIRRWVYAGSFLLALAGMFALEGALAHAGASRAVIGIFGAAVPILARALFHIARSGVTLDWPLFGLGAWLVVVVAAGAFAGPETVWGIYAVAAGPAYLLAAAVEPRLRQLWAMTSSTRSSTRRPGSASWSRWRRCRTVTTSHSPNCRR